MKIDVLGWRWGSRSGAPDGMAMAGSYLAWTLCELGHEVRAHYVSGSPPWSHPRASWVLRQPLFEPADWSADLVITTIAKTWRRTALSAERAGATSRLVFWHHYGSLPEGMGCRLATPLPLPYENDWERAAVLPPASWASDARELPEVGDAVLVPGAGRAKGGLIALAVARNFPGVPWVVLTGRATSADLAPWRGLSHVEILPMPAPPESYLARARALLSPTQGETYGLTLVEGAARGARVVCSDLPGTRFALGSSATFLPQNAPISEWGAALAAALGDHGPRERLRLPPYAETVAAALAVLSVPGQGKQRPRPPATPAAPMPPPARRRAEPAPVHPEVRPHFAIGSKLHVGCGPKRIAGWLNTDGVGGKGPDGTVDLHRPQLPPATFAAIYGCHVLEHCWPQDTPRILSSLRDALLPGGTLRLSVPDLRLVVANCLDSKIYGGEASALSVIYGGTFSQNEAAPDLHRQTFWRERLERLLTEAGLVNVRAWAFGQYPEIDEVRDYATWPRDRAGVSTISLNLEADRPGHLPRVRAAVDVSVLLGTVDRVELLRGCVDSVRRSLEGSGLSHEIVIAYGRESEPALPWMLEQLDVVPVLGGMQGAIEAFNRGYLATVGRYVCQINDDVTIDGDALARAVRHLDADPTSAGVVFKFDRGDGAGYRHEQLGGALHPNQIVARRSTCEAVVERIGGFWGDEQHRTDKTYGGDSAFGALCRHLGMRLDSVEGVTCRDLLAADALREGNRVVDPTHWSRWNASYRPMLEGPATSPAADEWPRLYVPRPGMPPRRSPLGAGAPLRLLHLSLRYDGEPQDDLRRALACIGPTLELPWHGREKEAIAAARTHQPDLVWAQIQSDAWTPDMTEALRRAVGPKCTLCLWTGDVRTSAAQPVERWLVRAGHGFDLVLADSITYPRKLKLDEAVPAACGYLGCGIDPTLNPWRPDETESGGAIFLGSPHRHLGGDDRELLLAEVARALPGVLAVYGAGWAKGPVAPVAHPFVDQASASLLMRRARVTISTSLFADLERYSSDRLKRAMASGAVVAVRRFPDMTGLGLVDGVNCLEWSTPAELVALIRRATALEQTTERRQIRERAAALAADRFTWDRVVEQLLAIVRDLRAR